MNPIRVHIGTVGVHHEDLKVGEDLGAEGDASVPGALVFSTLIVEFAEPAKGTPNDHACVNNPSMGKFHRCRSILIPKAPHWGTTNRGARCEFTCQAVEMSANRSAQKFDRWQFVVAPSPA